MWSHQILGCLYTWRRTRVSSLLYTKRINVCHEITGDWLTSAMLELFVDGCYEPAPCYFMNDLTNTGYTKRIYRMTFCMRSKKTPQNLQHWGTVMISHFNDTCAFFIVQLCMIKVAFYVHNRKHCRYVPAMYRKRKGGLQFFIIA